MTSSITTTTSLASSLVPTVSPLAFAGTGGPSVVIAPTTRGRTGSEILVNTSTAGSQVSPLIVSLSNGGFAVVWQDRGSDASGDIRAQTYSAAGQPVGAEILVSVATLNEQSEATVTALAGGGYVIAWRDLSQGVGGNPGDSNGWAIKGRMIGNDGQPLGGELVLNSHIDGSQVQPLLTSLPTGGFIATWYDTSTTGGDASGNSIRGRVFDASGAPLGPDFLVNTETSGVQVTQSVAVLSNGGFVVTWQDTSGIGGDGSGYGVKGQVFTAAGDKVGGEFLVNTATQDFQQTAEITALAGGRFAVTWLDNSQGVGGATGDTSGFAVKAQVFEADGTRVQGEILVNTATTNTQNVAQIVALANGGFVITWQDYSLGVGGATGDTTGAAIKAQVFGADGAKVGTELLVNSATASDQQSPQITALSDGGFVIVWSDGSVGVGGAAGDGSAFAVKAQVYDASGVRSGGELLVNTAISGNQSGPVVSALPGGGFVVSWYDVSNGVGGAGGDTSGGAIKAQVFGAAFTANEQTPLNLKALGLDVSDPDSGDVLTVTLSVSSGVITVDAGTSGATASGSGTASITLTGTAAQISALLNTDGGSVLSYSSTSDAPPANTTLTMSVDDGQGGTATTTAQIANVALNDAPVLNHNAIVTVLEGAQVVLTAADLDFNDADNADGSVTYTITTLPTNGTVFKNGSSLGLNGTFTQQDVVDGRIVFLHDGSETTSAAFGFSVSDGIGGTVTGRSFTFSITPVNDAPTVNVSGEVSPRGTEILVNTQTGGAQSAAQITTLGDGRFVVTWTDASSGNTDIKAQVFAASGAKLGGELPVNTAVAGAQSVPQITALDGGGFVIIWQDSSFGVGGAAGDPSGLATKARVYGSDGLPLGAEIRVNTQTSNDQSQAQVTALAGGGFAVVWTDLSAVKDGSGSSINLQVFNATGGAVGGETVVNTAVLNGQTIPQITTLAGGGFVVTWLDGSLGAGGATGDNSSSAVKAQVFTADGVRTGGEILVNTAVSGAQSASQITALMNGGFVVTWQDISLGVGGAGGDTSSGAIKAQMFGADGSKVGGEFRANTAVNGAQSVPQITTLSNGGFVITWTDNSLGSGGAGGDASGTAIKAQMFGANGAAVGNELLVNTAVSGTQSVAQITALADGGFVITWQDGSFGVGGATGDVSSTAIKAQAYDALGGRVGGEILVNTATFNAQAVPQITALPDGGFVITWQDISQGSGGASGDTSSTAVKAQVFNLGLSAIEQTTADFKARGLSVTDPDNSGDLTVTLSVDHGLLTLDSGTSGAVLTGSGTASVTITGTAAQINALLNTDPTSTFSFVTTSDETPAIATLTFVATDGAGGVTTTTAPIRLVAVVDASTAAADAFAANEGVTVTGNVLVDNGAGADTDPDHGGPRVVEVNGAPASVGTQITLASGALLTVNADGTFTYDQNGAFSDLSAPGSGSANTTATETFTYTLESGQTATATITITGVDDDDVFTGTAGDDAFVGGGGVDTVVYSGAASAVRVDLRLGAPQNTNGAGTDTLSGFENLIGSDFNDTLIGTAGENALTGGLGSDVLLGMGGNDILIGGAGAANTMQGGLGDDVYVVEANDTIVELAGQGRDRVETTRNLFNLSANVEDLTFTGTGNFTGYGNASNNVIIGGAGNDLLFGGAGLDTLNGGLGSDTAVYATAAGGVNADLTAGAASNDGDGGADVLTSIESLTGSAFNDTLTGAAGVNYLIGGAGDDVINGRGGNDWLYGGDGVDTVAYADATAGVTVHLYARTAQDGEGGMDVITGFESVTGSAFNDLLTGDEGDNELRGGAGRDVLLGREGTDRLFGGSGAANQLQGGAGDDAYYVDANDTIVELAGEGHDVVITTMNVFNLAANVEDLSFEGTGNFVGTGNASDNEIYGADGNDVLNGAAGQDSLNGGEGADILLGGDGNDLLDGGWDTVRDILIGGAGDDTYFLRAGDAVVEAIGGGNDTAYLLGDYTLAAGVELETMTANAAANQYNTTIVGNELANAINGGIGDNVLRGMAGNDRLNGDSGADRLEGGDGDDVMIGGYGDDLLFGGAGTDTARFSYDRSQYTLTDLGNGRYSISHNSAEQEGVDILEGIEMVRFSNGTFSVDSLFNTGAPLSVDKGEVGPQTLPTLADDDFLPVGKGTDLPLVLPGSDDLYVFDKHAGDALVLPGVADAGAWDLMVLSDAPRWLGQGGHGEHLTVPQADDLLGG